MWFNNTNFLDHSDERNTTSFLRLNKDDLVYSLDVHLNHNALVEKIQGMWKIQGMLQSHWSDEALSAYVNSRF